MGEALVPAVPRLLMCVWSALLVVAALPAGAQEKPLVKREILALYDGAADPEIQQSMLHRAAELPLNHLGYVVHYHDVRTTLPPADTVAATYAAVLTWFNTELKEPRPYLRWAAAVARRGVRLIIFGDIGGDDGGRSLDLVNAMLEPMGLRHLGDFIRSTDGSRAIVHDVQSYGYEGNLGPVIPGLAAVAVADPRRTKALVEVEAGPDERGRRTIAVAAGPGGAYAASFFEVRYNPHAERLSWLINPFRIFSLVLGTGPMPIPDVTTVTGRRLYFSHIDGDGWNNGAQMSPYLEAEKIASEVMLKELIEPYPDLPVTVGLIAGDVLADEGGNPETEGTARQMYALPQVEIGSHTCTHPFTWSFYQPYDRARELKLVNEAQSESEGRMHWLGKMVGLPGFASQEYVSGSNKLPRAYLRHPFDLGQEVDRAIELTERLAPPGKKLKVYQWSGDALPFEAAIARTRHAGLRNINGGDSRFDAEFPSMIYVPPVGLEVGHQRQIYAVNSNENTYTNDWTGPYYAFRNLAETVRNTELPRRLKGINIYYHTYSAERQASLDAVKAMLDLARSMPIAPITTSHYAAIADGFYTTRIRQSAENLWTIEGRGALDTIRFEDAEAIATDFSRSEGVLGETRHAGALYVALDPENQAPKVAISPRTGSESSPERPVLVNARWQISKLAWQSACEFSFSAQGFGKGEMDWRVESAATFSVTARDGEKIRWQGTAVSDREGRLAYAIPPSDHALSVRLQCTRPEGRQAEVHAN